MVLLLFAVYSEENQDKNFFFNPHLWKGSKFLPMDQRVLEAANQAPGDGLHSGREDRLRHVEGSVGRALTQRGLQEEDELAHACGICPGRGDLLSRP